jgi:hypothetical protein
MHRLANALAVGADQQNQGSEYVAQSGPATWEAKRIAYGRPPKPTHCEPFLGRPAQPASELLRCPGSQALAANTASSRVLAEGAPQQHPAASCRLGEPCLLLRLSARY